MKFKLKSIMYDIEDYKEKLKDFEITKEETEWDRTYYITINSLEELLALVKLAEEFNKDDFFYRGIQIDENNEITIYDGYDE